MARLSSPPRSPSSKEPRARKVGPDGRVGKAHQKDRLKVFSIESGAAPASGGVSSSLSSSDAARMEVQNKSFRFLDLPGEIRNQIYELCLTNTEQALIAHLPRLRTLRPRRSESTGPRVDRRRCKGLTQVCSAIRNEFRPMYMLGQEVGLDFTDLAKYIEAFYPKGIALDAQVGNITIAISSKITAAEKDPNGIDVFPMLDIWANSYRIEAGFGRYFTPHYDARLDGEAKDLYRLFGRKVLPDRSCSAMNRDWRHVLRRRMLASVRVHRAPTNGDRPFLQILYKAECRESCLKSSRSYIDMSTLDSQGMIIPSWLERFGFDDMEWFEVKVGALPLPPLPKGPVPPQPLLLTDHP
ncbi:hypothetical protein BU24DRAFT_459855 [Aaosphaeria arxii CBS 175.79]|uniref:F-box domain-containing protein n=1 Tax=Aaosphaeria arxii CBS 175.79 TaxID=1450172 RepID=A0A6A5Y436_9PLEO|nr:uncharacterized protein BU24DRAFT_459855 [Aaosphaeria arxii CBS 175.79]KAF2020258.1 hypothetical protein BU24DRAFT_459855 [Aaosphaeria arxii CBS 175.79]